MAQVRSKITRDPIEFDSLIRKWTGQARAEGLNFKLMDTKRLITMKMKNMDFVNGVFRERTLAEDLFGKRRKR